MNSGSTIQYQEPITKDEAMEGPRAQNREWQAFEIMGAAEPEVSQIYLQIGLFSNLKKNRIEPLSHF
jgi:hypothetical protein